MSQQKIDALLRSDGRNAIQVRPIAITPQVFEYAPGSVLFEIGKTKILCAVSMQHQIPSFLKGKKEGWLTCEYAMLPMATNTRTQRDSNLSQRNGRSVEISRFLGRVFRTVIDTSVFPDQTIIVDCDVLQADGSTRVACVTAASLALSYAQQHWLKEKVIAKNIIKEPLYGISVGVVQHALLIDLNYIEDSKAQSDFNIVLTESGKLVEILGGSETDPISLEVFSEIQMLAVQGVDFLKKEIKNLSEQLSNPNVMHEANVLLQQEEQKTKKIPLFSIQNRLFNSSKAL
jgi:ribonuclease PH